MDKDLIEFLERANIGDGPNQTTYLKNYEGKVVHWIEFASYWNTQIKHLKTVVDTTKLPNLYFGFPSELNSIQALR